MAQTDSIPMKRTAATEIFDDIREKLAGRISPELIEEWLRVKHNIPPLEKCDGEHRQDNCGVCSPRWGYTGPRVVIR